MEINPSNIGELKNNLYNKKMSKSYKQLLSLNLFMKRQQQYNAFIKKTPNVSFYDRSMIDVIGYLNYWGEKYPTSWDLQSRVSNTMSDSWSMLPGSVNTA